MLTTTALAGCTEGDGGSGGDPLNGGGDGGGLEILSSRGETTEYGSVMVVGRARNDGDDALGYAQIEAYFYDASEARVGSGVTNINNLGAGRVWNFECLCLDCPDPSRVAAYSLEVTAEW